MEKIIKKIQENSCYLHVYGSGRILYISGKNTRGIICNLDFVIYELEQVSKNGGILYYSLADSEAITSELYDQVIDNILAIDLETQMVNPHPQVYFYYKSFVPYLNEALEAAAMDVQGLLYELQENETKLNDLELSDQKLYEIIEYMEELKSRYYVARAALNDITKLHYQLCVQDELNNS